MEAFDVLSASKEKDDSISLTIVDPTTGERRTRRFADIRMGIHWPTSLSPACFVIVSQEYTGPHKHGQSESPVGTREVIAEYVSESLGMNQFYQQVVHVAKKLLCRRLYAILPENHSECGYFQDLEKYARKAECNIYVDGVTEGGEFFLNITRIKDGIDDGNLVVPDSTIVYDQLKGMTREDLQDSPEERFYCVDALGHVIDGLYRWPPRNYPLIDKKRHPPDWRYN